MPDSPFAADFRALLSRHGITHPRFAHNSEPFNPEKPRVLYSGPVFDQEEMVAAVGALCEGKWSVGGEYVHRFEQAFSKVVGAKETVAVNSGSSADLLMIAAAKKRFGWKDGDGVIVSPCGFPTSVSAITLNGLVPVFVDIEWETLNFDLRAIQKTLNRHYSVLEPEDWPEMAPRWEPPCKIRAILVSPVLGNPPDIDRLFASASAYGAKLLLDGCDSLGTTWRGKPLSTYFAASTCSYYPAHHISTLNGGSISSDDIELIEIARSMAAWGRSCRCFSTANMSPNGVCGKRFSRWLPNVDCDLDHRYVYSNIGYNLQQVDALAAIGLAQLDKLDDIHVARKFAFRRIQKAILQHIPATPVVVHPDADVSWFGMPVILSDPDLKRRLVAHLEANQIQTRSYFAGNLCSHPAYSHLGNAADYLNANEVLCRVFWLGVSPSYTEEHFAHIEKTLREFPR